LQHGVHKCWVDPKILARRFQDSSGPSEKLDFFPKTGRGILGAAHKPLWISKFGSKLEIKPRDDYRV